MVRMFVNVERNEGQHARNRRNKTGAAGQCGQEPADAAAKAPMPERGSDGGYHAGIEKPEGRLRLKAGSFGSDGFRLLRRTCCRNRR
jgi:hypothetical protein